jgi:hypothetical protein
VKLRINKEIQLTELDRKKILEGIEKSISKAIKKLLPDIMRISMPVADAMLDHMRYCIDKMIETRYEQLKELIPFEEAISASKKRVAAQMKATQGE